MFVSLQNIFTLIEKSIVIQVIKSKQDRYVLIYYRYIHIYGV